MNEVAFVEQREPDWLRLNALCDRADASPVQLREDELEELIRLYKRASTDLAQVRTKSNNLQLIEFLNSLTTRAYGILYRTPRGRFKKSLVFAMESAAQAVRHARWHILASALTFLIGALFAYVVLDVAPESRAHFVPEGFESSFEAWKTDFEERSTLEAIAATSFYSSNNPMAALATVGLSIGTFGLGTAALLWQNGNMIGALAYELTPYGRVGHLLTWVAPHGVTEIGGLFIVGGAGYLLGHALIAPGRRSRGEALRRAGRHAIVLIVLSVVMMFIAAPIEGFFSFNPRVPNAAKIAFAVFSFIAWMLFFIGYGREKEELQGLGHEHGRG
jgi:uncharacterized membrane protein SpoIIM required for sporulation